MQALEYLVQCEKTEVNLHRQMNRRYILYIHRMITRDKAAKSEASDEPRVQWRAPSVYPVVHGRKTIESETKVGYSYPQNPRRWISRRNESRWVGNRSNHERNGGIYLRTTLGDEARGKMDEPPGEARSVDEFPSQKPGKARRVTATDTGEG
jgi:hypothetical protein